MRARTLALPLLIASTLPGCAPSEARRAEDRAAIEALLADYASRLSETYRTGDGATLREVATEREVARVLGQVAELSHEGRALRPELRRQAIESIEIHRATAATAVTVETWSLRVVAIGSEAVVSESPEQENRIVYSLTREGGRWWILSRTLRHSTEP